MCGERQTGKILGSPKFPLQPKFSPTAIVSVAVISLYEVLTGISSTSGFVGQTFLFFLLLINRGVN